MSWHLTKFTILENFKRQNIMILHISEEIFPKIEHTNQLY